MNAFYEHHKDSIRFGYRCFDLVRDRLGKPAGERSADFLVPLIGKGIP